MAIASPLVISPVGLIMTIENLPPTQLIYGLDDRPPFSANVIAALQHIMASIVGIMTATLVIASALGLEAYLPHLLSMGLIASGIGTFIQARRFGLVGAGMICLQGTAFVFVSALIGAGMAVKSQGGTPEQIMSAIFSLCLFGGAIQVLMAFFLPQMKRVLTPVVTGIVITLIGISLIKVGITDFAGGLKSPTLGQPANLLLGGLVTLIIIGLSWAKNQWIKLSAILIGLIVGCLVAALTGMWEFKSVTDKPALAVPVPFEFGFNFYWSLFIPVALAYAIAAIETAGDVTANCMLCERPIEGPSFMQRIRGALNGDAVGSVVAATIGAFPSTTFAQNNGVIAVTGIGSWRVGMTIGGLLILLGLFPWLGATFQQIPKPVLGGATVVMFGTVAACGIRILAQAQITRRNLMIIAVSFGFALGFGGNPALLEQLPKWLANILHSPATIGALVAITLNLILPDEIVPVLPLPISEKPQANVTSVPGV